MGTLLFLFGLLVLVHQLEVIVGRAGLQVNHKVLFYTHKGVLKPSEIADMK